MAQRDVAGRVTVEREVKIAASPEVVYAHLTDPARMVRWKGVSAELDARTGGLFRVQVTGRNIVRGTYVELLPFRRVVFTWGWEGEDSPLPPGSSTVEVTLTPHEGGTLVRLRHIGLPEAVAEQHAAGWDHFLPRLATAASGTDPGPDPWASAP